MFKQMFRKWTSSFISPILQDKRIRLFMGVLEWSWALILSLQIVNLTALSLHESRYASLSPIVCISRRNSSYGLMVIKLSCSWLAGHWFLFGFVWDQMLVRLVELRVKDLKIIIGIMDLRFLTYARVIIFSC